jgi:hypothetical protein
LYGPATGSLCLEWLSIELVVRVLEIVDTVLVSTQVVAQLLLVVAVDVVQIFAIPLVGAIKKYTPTTKIVQNLLLPLVGKNCC